MSQLWRKLVKLFHPDRFAHEPEKQETYHKLTAAINHAKDHGNLATLRRIAEDPHGFILRQGWAALDFGDDDSGARLAAQASMVRARAVIDLADALDTEIEQRNGTSLLYGVERLVSGLADYHPFAGCQAIGFDY